jgi:hypothetical protein
MQARRRQKHMGSLPKIFLLANDAPPGPLFPNTPERIHVQGNDWCRDLPMSEAWHVDPLCKAKSIQETVSMSMALTTTAYPHISTGHMRCSHQDIITSRHKNTTVVRFGGTGCTPLSARPPVIVCQCALAASHAQCASSPYDACCAGFMDDVQSMANQQARAVKQSQCGICKAKRQATCGSRAQRTAGRTSCMSKGPNERWAAAVSKLRMVYRQRQRSQYHQTLQVKTTQVM